MLEFLCSEKAFISLVEGKLRAMQAIVVCSNSADKSIDLSAQSNELISKLIHLKKTMQLNILLTESQRQKKTTVQRIIAPSFFSLRSQGGHRFATKYQPFFSISKGDFFQ